MPNGDHDQEAAGESSASAAAAARTRPLRKVIAARAWVLLAYVALGLGFIGIFLPGLPTVPFILLAAFAAARGSERLHRWLLAHPRFGPMIRDWQDHGAVTRRSKWLASVTMAFCAVVMFLTAPAGWMAATGTAIMAVTATWLWCRPEPPRP